MVPRLLGCSLLVGLAAASSTQLNAAEKVTPMERVMELLSKLSAQVAEEGKVEAEQYDKYACFCKDNADKKLYNIEKSNKVIAEQTAKIDKLATEISGLNGEIEALTL